jgi:hypothetical protein
MIKKLAEESVEALSVEALIERFVDISVAQDDALLDNKIARFNRLFDEKAAILAELKSRPGDQRRRLVSLFGHSNPQVRLNAAKATLAVEPEAARQALQAIADSREFPQAGDAGMSLWNLDRGVFKPT